LETRQLLEASIRRFGGKQIQLSEVLKRNQRLEPNVRHVRGREVDVDYWLARQPIFPQYSPTPLQHLGYGFCRGAGFSDRVRNEQSRHALLLARIGVGVVAVPGSVGGEVG